MRGFNTTRSWIIMALMTAISIVMSRFFSFQTDILRISLGYVPIILTGALLGPVQGAVVGVVADFLGTVLFSPYAWFPPLALAPMFIGLWSGFMRGVVSKNVLFSTILVNLGGNIIGRIVISSFFLNYLYGTGFAALLASRIPLCIVMTCIESALIYLLMKSPVKNYSIQRER